MPSEHRHLAERLSVAVIVSIALHLLFLAKVHDWRVLPPMQNLIAPTYLAAGDRASPMQVNLAGGDASTPAILAIPAIPANNKPEALSSLQLGRATSVTAPLHVPSASVPAPAQTQPIEGQSASGTSHAAPHFLSPREVDMRAYPLNRPPIDDFQSQSYSVNDVVRLRVYVDTSGHVDHVEALPETTAPADFVDHMITSITNTLFAPATRAGAPVNSYFDVDLSIAAARPPLQEVRP